MHWPFSLNWVASLSKGCFACPFLNRFLTSCLVSRILTLPKLLGPGLKVRAPDRQIGNYENKNCQFHNAKYLSSQPCSRINGWFVKAKVIWTCTNNKWTFPPFNSFSRFPTMSRLSSKLFLVPTVLSEVWWMNKLLFEIESWMKSSNEQEVTFPGRPMILARLSPGFVKGTFLYSPL